MGGGVVRFHRKRIEMEAVDALLLRGRTVNRTVPVRGIRQAKRAMMLRRRTNEQARVKASANPKGKQLLQATYA